MMASIIQSYKLSWLQKMAISLLKCGPIPNNGGISFIMDGNRRYANKAKIGKADGHKQGFDTLAKVLSWCRELGITQVTLYAFSIENFKRTPEEVDSIMNLAREKCDSLLDELDKVNEAGIRIRIAGDLDLLPQDLKDRVERIQNMTCNNEKACLNICLAYTSRHELVAAIKQCSAEYHQGGYDGERNADDINMTSFEKKLYLSRPFPELIIRTSGEVRLSDFMLWQCQKSMLIFVDALWPEISFWDFMKAIFYFQNQKRYAQNFIGNCQAQNN